MDSRNRDVRKSIKSSKSKKSNQTISNKTISKKRSSKIYKKSPNITKAWNRGFHKYADKQYLLSPIKQTEAILNCGFHKDLRIDGCIWILSMSEQFYYENTINTLVLTNDDDLVTQKILLKNISSQSIERLLATWDKITVLGSGTYGRVYKVYDTSTDQYLAVKYLKKLNDAAAFKDNVKKIISYLQERYYLTQAYNSPFVIKFKYSFQLETINGLFLVTDYCSCDMSVLLSMLSFFCNDTVLEMFSNKGRNNDIVAHHNKYARNYFFQTLEVVKIYIFELFCILDFLSKCKIVHRDIKPANVMIAINGHLKLGDFGMVSNTKFIYSSLFKQTIDSYAIHNLNDSAESMNVCGTAGYYEMEAVYMRLKYTNLKLFDVLQKSRGFTPPNITRQTYRMDFSSDLWAVGVIIIELLFLGRPIIDNKTPKYIKDYLGFVQNEILYNSGRLFLIKPIYDSIIIGGLNSFANGRFEQIFRLLLEIFKPKHKRAINYTKDTMLKVYNRCINTRVIDMTKIENIDLFKSSDVNLENVLFYNFSKEYLESLIDFRDRFSYTSFTPVNIKDWIKSLQLETQNCKKMFGIEPGCSLNWEC